MPNISTNKPLDLNDLKFQQTTSMSKTSGNGFAIRGKLDQESKISDDDAMQRLKRHNHIIRLSSRDSVESGTQSRKSSRHHHRTNKNDLSSYLRNGLIKSRDQPFRYTKAQDLQTQRRSQFTQLKP